MANVACSKCPKGTDMTLYYNTNPAGTSPVWVEHCGMVEDLDMNEVEDVQELTGRRESRQVKEYNEGDIELSITGTMITDPDYEGWIWINAARTGGTPQDCAVLTGLISEVGSYGWRGMFWNSDRSNRGPASGSMTTAVNLQPSAPCINPHDAVRVVKVLQANAIANFDPTVRI